MFYGSGFGFWDLRQASQAQAAASRATHAGRRAQSDVRLLEERLDKLMLVNMALWDLIKDKTGLTDEELAAKVEQLDLADGEADGKVSRELTRCGRCGRAISPRHSRCMYCGTERPDQTVFDTTN
ncbi:MAG: hypothetical protein KGY99_06015 [Phycisphaerae bacterium]|nr:hypothetical protein [Phycisphaerae bacterium]